MKKLQLLLLSLLVAVRLCGQTPTEPIRLSVADLLETYGLDSTLVADTAAAMDWLAGQPQDYVALTNQCVLMRSQAQRAITSLGSEYPMRDSLIWIDSHVVVTDYALYEYKLRAFADLMGRMSIRYSRLEQQRLEAEKEAARQRALEEQRRQQEERNQQAMALKQSIDHHHRTIIAACDGAGITDKAKLKELKDLYYSYLMVYNKYDLSATNASPQSLKQLEELNGFQNDLLENVLGGHSLPQQIDNFKNQLKARCEKDNTDVYRSYTKVFKNTSVPISFADIKEYGDYTNRMRTIVAVQQRYLDAIDLRNTIEQNSEQILRRYSKKYRDVANSYKETVRSLNMLPAFTTNAESLSFIRALQEFIEAQQVYLDSYSTLEELTRRSDTIIATSQSAYRDVAASYRELRPSLQPMPMFKNPREAEQYLEQLRQVDVIQRQYLGVIACRDTLRVNTDSINSMRRVDRVLWNGYRQLQQHVQFTPNFVTVDRGESFIAALKEHIAIQRQVLRIFGQRKQIASTASSITGKSNPYRNIAKAYQRMEKAYEGLSDIITLDDLNRYGRQCTAIAKMQQAFVALVASEHAMESDNMLHRETDISKIKIVLGMD
ncbi:MAG: hypothetical protein J6I49_07855 [Bacteroidales bacterium]|nr:hypothetical protein [Bacteroidales bacterium]